MFLDASAVVAVLTREKEAEALLAKITGSSQLIHYSSVTMFEAVIGISRKTAISLYGDQRPTPPELIAQAQQDVEEFMLSIGAIEVAFPHGLHVAALEVARTYGRFVGHPAKLNFGDCFSYAAARVLKLPLLFVGNDFSRTDIEVA
ncbi:type II toxin-antitoxin system VapC family toxin [Neorhizobium galegae]|uniref:type II toxin-antitoxin system VapC family toxin n=1 Tax=Neorhizobium galegae TaxID=399 RepID=UPI000621B394|nr:type II toxin-antitoxin system VapC family toxin [Neorhizobium galegae]CDZ27178.1 Probable ribonuclease VapC 7 [Neorhizobium galegae bv. officinalis]KAA9385023.1 type II toxin-antitoxin system VapC family toxin [Neorhizobium galegae]KAB1110637.1 type II toxin-antitoxin system VapC family toxin [Neorhizobium galegae]MCM2497756.1 type II toxin-antitoxin system VapC family toxin [Neorhizobium galegae]MCQ1773688.1 type II toxin-antitoxin system VapC family toxin [Neorhizobium galegae]